MIHSGICYDGPLEGKRIDSSLKSLQFVERGSKNLEYWYGIPSAVAPVKFTEYRWCDPIRKWVYRG